MWGYRATILAFSVGSVLAIVASWMLYVGAVVHFRLDLPVPVPEHVFPGDLQFFLLLMSAVSWVFDRSLRVCVVLCRLPSIATRSLDFATDVFNATLWGFAGAPSLMLVFGTAHLRGLEEIVFALVAVFALALQLPSIFAAVDRHGATTAVADYGWAEADIGARLKERLSGGSALVRSARELPPSIAMIGWNGVVFMAMVVLRVEVPLLDVLRLILFGKA